MASGVSWLFLLAFAANLIVLQKLVLGRVRIFATAGLLLAAEFVVLAYDPVDRFFYLVVDQVLFRGGCLP